MRATSQACWFTGPAAPDDDLVRRLYEPVDLALVDVPLSQLCQELSRQIGIRFVLQEAVLGEDLTSYKKVTFRANQMRLGDVLNALSEQEWLEWQLRGSLVWLWRGSNELPEPCWIGFYPVADLVARLNDPRAPFSSHDFLDIHNSVNGEMAVVGDLLVVFNDDPRYSEVRASLAELRQAAFDPSPAATRQALDRQRRELQARLQQRVSLETDDPLLSDRLAKLAAAAGIVIEVDPAWNERVLRRPAEEEPADDPFGGGPEESPEKDPVADERPESLPPWTLDQESLARALPRLLGPLGLIAVEEGERLRIARAAYEAPETVSYLSLRGLLAANQQIEIDELDELLDYGLSLYESTRYGSLLKITSRDPAVHAAHEELIRRLCDHGRDPERKAALEILLPRSSIRSEPRIARLYPIGDMRPDWAKTLSYWLEEGLSGHVFPTYGNYWLVVEKADTRASCERLLELLRSPAGDVTHRRVVQVFPSADAGGLEFSDVIQRPVTLHLEQTTIDQAAARLAELIQLPIDTVHLQPDDRELVFSVHVSQVPLGMALEAICAPVELTFKWTGQGFLLTARDAVPLHRFTQLYEAPDLTPLHPDFALVETLLDFQSRVAPEYPIGFDWDKYASAHGASWRSLWRPLDAEQQQLGLELSLDALARLKPFTRPGVPPGRHPVAPNGSEVDKLGFGDYLMVAAAPHEHFALQRYLQQVAQPPQTRLADRRVTLQAENEPLWTVLDRWSRAEQAPLMMMHADSLVPHLHGPVTCNVVDQPLMEFLQQQFGKEGVIALDAAGVILLGTPSALVPDGDGLTTEIFDLRRIQERYPEWNGRQLSQWLLEATGYYAWREPLDGELHPAREHVLQSIDGDTRLLMPIGGSLAVRQRREIVEQIATLLRRLERGDFDTLPRPAFLFADSQAHAATKAYVGTLATTADDATAALAAFWLTEAHIANLADLQPLVDVLARSDIRNRPAQLLAICRVAADHRLERALPHLVEHLQHETKPEVRATLLAALAALGPAAAEPLGQSLRTSQGEESRQIICHLWSLDEAAKPVVDDVLSWAFVDQSSPDELAYCAAFASYRGLLADLDPTAETTLAILDQWSDSPDERYRQAVPLAERAFQDWPAFSKAQRGQPIPMPERTPPQYRASMPSFSPPYGKEVKRPVLDME